MRVIHFSLPKIQYKPEFKEIFYYIYGVLHSNTYRHRYEDQLVRNFPRIPFPEEESIFKSMSKIGECLANLHMLKSHDLDPTRFQMSETISLKITDISYNVELQRIYLQKPRRGNDNQITWIGGITPDMWEFRIGGIQQLKQWLYARRYRTEYKKNTIPRAITDQELDQFLKICDSIAKTINLIPKIDEVYEKIDPE